MKVLDINRKLVLTSNKEQTKILQIPKMTLFGSPLKISFKLGCLQYETGIAALCKGCVVHIHDFKFNRELKQIDTYLNLQKVCIMKNIIIAAAEQRILIYDLIQNATLCHIPTANGKFCAINYNYMNLKLIYPISQNLFEEQQIHTAKLSKLQLLNMRFPPLYDKSGKIVSIRDGNTISLYEDQQIIRGCSFHSEISEIIPTEEDRQFYVKTEDGGKNNQPLWIKVSNKAKKYLTRNQNEQQSFDVQFQGSDSGIMIPFENQLLIWKNNKVYKTSIDDQPEFYGSSKKIQSPKQSSGQLSKQQQNETTAQHTLKKQTSLELKQQLQK